MIDTDDERSLDSVERRLLRALMDDGRASLETLSERLDVPLVTVADALRRLETEGIIASHRPELNDDAIGVDATAIVRLSVDRAALDEVVAELRDDPRLIAVYEVAGDEELVAVWKFASRSRLNERIGELLTRPAVGDASISLVERIACEYRQFVPGPDED